MSQLPKASDYLKSKGWKPDNPNHHPRETDWRNPKVDGGKPYKFINALMVQYQLDMDYHYRRDLAINHSVMQEDKHGRKF